MWISRFHVRNKSTVNFLIHFTNRFADRAQKSTRLSDILLLHHRTMCQFYAGLQKYKGGCNLVATFAQCSKKIFTFVQGILFCYMTKYSQWVGIFFRRLSFLPKRGHRTFNPLNRDDVDSNVTYVSKIETTFCLLLNVSMIFSFFIVGERCTHGISSFKNEVDNLLLHIYY